MNDVLRTKLNPAQLRSPLVHRAALLARLDAAANRRLTLLAAPAGYGKTTLLGAWCATRSELPVAWVTLDTGDNDPQRFWRYVVAALQSVEPALPNVMAPYSAGAAPTALLNTLAGLPGRCVLVLEDYHTIAAPEVHAALTMLLEQAPFTLGIIALTRDDPPLPLARLRAHNDLAEFRAADLRYTPDEVEALLGADRPLPGATLARIMERSGGWPAGLHLALLALAHDIGPAEAAVSLATCADAQQHVAAYLATDVLPALPEALQRFLLETSVLERLSPELCDAVTDNPHGATHLAALERADLFVEPVEGEQGWLHLIPIVAEALRDEAARRYGVAHMRVLRTRAARWLAAHGQPEAAIEAMLAAAEFPAAADLIEAITRHNELPTDIYVMRRWVEALPAGLLPAHPHMCLAYASALLFAEDRRAPALLPRIEAPLELAEHAWLTAGDRPQLGVALAVRSVAAWWQGQLTQSVVAARQALALLAGDQRQWRAACLLNQGMGEIEAGRLDEAEQLIQTAYNSFIRGENRYGQRAAAGLLADLALLRADVRQAAQIYEQSLAEAADDPSDQGAFLVRLARIDYMHNELDSADARVEQALSLAERHVDLLGRWTVEADIFAPAALVRARIHAARGDLGAAQDLLALLAARLMRHDNIQLHRELQAELARYALVGGDLVAVQRWVTAAGQPGAPVSALQQEREALLVARWLIAQGEAGAAIPAVRHRLAEAEAGGRVFSTIEARVVLAQAQFAVGKAADADATLLGALQRARSHRLLRLFMDEGSALGTLLERQLTRLGAHDPLHAFARELLSSMPGSPAPVLSQPSFDRLHGLAEPLTRQEQRVLRLVGAGLSNPEIAAELVVSVNTIKTQLQSIYRKLGINSRREARALTRNQPGGTTQI